MTFPLFMVCLAQLPRIISPLSRPDRTAQGLRPDPHLSRRSAAEGRWVRCELVRRPDYGEAGPRTPSLGPESRGTSIHLAAVPLRSLAAMSAEAEIRFTAASRSRSSSLSRR